MGSEIIIKLLVHGVPLTLVRSEIEIEISAMSASSSKSLKALCEEVKGILPERFREEGWYLVVVCPYISIFLLELYFFPVELCPTTFTLIDSIALFCCLIFFAISF